MPDLDTDEIARKAAQKRVSSELRALGRRRRHHRERLEAVAKATRPLVFRAAALGVEKKQIAEDAGMTRRAVYDILEAGE